MLDRWDGINDPEQYESMYGLKKKSLNGVVYYEECVEFTEKQFKFIMSGVNKNEQNVKPCNGATNE